MTKESEKKDLIPIPKLKRLFDIVFSVFLLTLTLPLFILILAGIQIEHLLRGKPGARLFYVEKRISQGRTFPFIKFNLFKPGRLAALEAKGRFIHTKSLEHDGHSLSIMGWIIQHVYLDELPQIFCIIAGYMSFVGPRPVNTEVYRAELKKKSYIRHRMKTGLTGTFQSHKGDKGINQFNMDEEYMLYTLANPSWKVVLRDIKVMTRTLWIMIKAEGR